MSRYVAFFEQSLTRLKTNEGKSIPKVMHDSGVFFVLDPTEQLRILQRQIQGTLSVFVFESLAMNGQPHQSIEHIAANLPYLAIFQSSDVRGSRRSVQARHFPD